VTPGEVRRLVRLAPPRRDALARCRTVADVREAARRRLPRPVFDYVDGGADEEISLRANEAGWRAYRFAPRVLVDVSRPALTTRILGAAADLPLGLAPTGYTRMIHPDGEAAVGRAAAAAGVPYVLSTMASTSLEEVRAGLPEADLWFQLYVWKDRGRTRDLVARAHAEGYRVLEVAVDTAVSGRRLRDVRNGLTIPPQLGPGTLARIGARPRYWARLLRAPALTFAHLTDHHPDQHTGPSGAGHTVADIGALFDPAVSWRQLEELRELWPGKLAIKGPVGPDDAVTAASLGVDAVHLSNHGGRQLDRSIAPVDLIAPVRAAVGDRIEILVDSGIRHGADVATAVALGADAAFVGRPYLYGLAVGRERGVAHVIALLREELTRTLQLLGVASIAELRAEGARLLSRGPCPGS